MSTRLALAMSWLLIGLACNNASSSASNAPVSAVDFESEECAVCGMLVREQPAPRAQAIFRDATRAFVCSPAELIQLIAAPSAHGKPAALFVETVAPDVDPAQLGAAPSHAWIDAQRAWYVVGVPRSGVMGTPLLAYAERSAAERVAARFGGRVADWAASRAVVLGTTP